MRFVTQLFTRVPLALASAICLWPALGFAQERVPIEPPPTVPNRQQRPEGYQKHAMRVVEGAESESDRPYELTIDPGAGRPDDACGTEAVPAYLKDDPYRLSFWGGDYAPASGERLDPALAREWRDPKRTKQHTYGFVMFQGRITAAKQKRVEALGVRLFEFHTFQCFKAEIPFTAIPALLVSPDVRWLGYAKMQQKLDPRVLAQLADPNALHELFVTVFDSDMTPHATRRLVADAERNSPFGNKTASEADNAYVTLPNGPFHKQLEQDGAEVTAYYDDLRVFVVKAKSAVVEKLVEHDFVHFVEAIRQQAAAHDRSTRLIGVDLVRMDINSGGAKTVTGILDTGFHIRGPANPNGHLDLKKETFGWDFVGGGVYNDTVGHGTHVAGTFVGIGTVDDRFRGCSPGAGITPLVPLYLAKVLPGTGANLLSGIARFQNAVSGTDWPDVVNYSGATAAPSAGSYGTETTSRAVDISVWAARQVYCVAAGNFNRFGRDAWMSCGTPATAKNALTVAAGNTSPLTESLIHNDERPFAVSGALARDGTFLLKVTPSASHPDLRVTGFWIRTQHTSSTTMTGYLYLADAAGKPTGSPVRTASFSVGTTQDYYGPAWDRITLPANKPFFIGFKTPSTGTLTGPWTTDSAATMLEEYYYKSSISTTFAGPFAKKLVYRVFCAADTGETSGISALGPTRDGRIKPNISAPGSSIVSCRTGTPNGYIAMSGTSQATPHVSGVVADLMTRWSAFKRNPALTKAQLTATANPYGASYAWARTSPSSYERSGFGQVDAYKSMYTLNSSSGWTGGWSTSNFTSTTSGASFDVTIPSDATRTMFVLNFDETAASTGATRAALADLDLYLDVEPFTSGFNTGEYSSRRAWDTWDWYGNVGSIAAVRGKKVRVKIYPRVRPASGTTARVGVSWVAYRGNTTPASTISVTAPAAVKPNETFTVSATTNVPSTVMTNTVLALSLPLFPTGWTIEGRSFTNPENIVRQHRLPLYTTDWIGYAVLGHQGYWYPSLHRTVNWQVRSSSTGMSSVCVDMLTDNGHPSGTYRACRSICVDGSPPKTITGLTSTNHVTNVWSRNPQLKMKWIAPAEVGCAGLLGYATSTSEGSPSTPPTTRNLGLVTTHNATVGSSSRPQYYNIRPVDAANNFGAATSWGPFFIDTTSPSLIEVSIDGGAIFTNSLNVTVKSAATDTYSGTSEIRYSGDGTTWSSWTAYTGGSVSRDLSADGGTSSEGTKYQYVQVRDKAGNVSSVVSDTIVFDGTAPDILGIAIAGGAAFTKDLTTVVKVDATDALSGLDTMRLSSDGSTWSAWMPYRNTAISYDLSSNGGNTSEGTKRVYAQIKDKAGNVSAAKFSSIVFDKSAPVLISVALNGGAAFTSSLNVIATISASGGPTEIRYSNDGTTWSPWQAYTASLPVDLTAFGGSSRTGSKTVHVVVRDGALNESGVKTDSITYLPKPVVSSVSSARLTVINKTKVRVIGTGFANVDHIRFGSKTMTSHLADEWYDGYFQVVNDTAIDLWSPQGLAPGTYALRIGNPGFESTATNVSIVHNTTRLLGVPDNLTRGKTLHVLTHLGSEGPGTIDLLTFSASQAPLLIPGLIGFQHGGNATSFIDPTFTILPTATPHDPTTKTAHWALPIARSLPAVRLYFQSMMIDPRNPYRAPILTSTMDSVLLY